MGLRAQKPVGPDCEPAGARFNGLMNRQAIHSQKHCLPDPEATGRGRCPTR